MPELVYLDTCVFIELLQQNNPLRFDSCEELRLRAMKNELVIVTSSVTIAEVIKLPALTVLPKEQSEKILKFFENPYINVRGCDRATAEYAHNLSNTYGLTPLDAIHVSTAVRSKASVLYTYDDKKGKRKGLIGHSEKIGTPPLRIEKPPNPDLGTLLDPKVAAKNAASAPPADDSEQ